MKEKTNIAVLLLPDFSPSFLSVISETIFQINRFVNIEKYQVEYFSFQDAHLSFPITSMSTSCAFQLLEKHPLYDHIFIIGDYAEKNRDFSKSEFLSQLCKAASGSIYAIGDSIWPIAQTGYLNGRNCSVHWSFLQRFRNEFPEVNAFDTMLTVNEEICTCVGGPAIIDFVLRILEENENLVLVTYICDRLIVDHMQLPRHRQFLRPHNKYIAISPTLNEVIDIMERNVQNPLRIRDIAEKVNLSTRQVERIFIHKLGCTPSKYYVQLRLELAKQMLVQTDCNMGEVSKHCGFVSRSHFSKRFREYFRYSPRMLRDKRSVQAQAA